MTGEAITAVQPVQPATAPGAAARPAAVPLAVPTRPAVPAVASVPVGTISTPQAPVRAPAGARRPSSDAMRPRSQVTHLVVNIDARRVALFCADGPPYRGFVDTDLATGAYTVKVDRRARRWVFDAAQVRSQPRFGLLIDGPDPFALDFAASLSVAVTSGLDMPALPDFAATAARVDQYVYDRDYRGALALLCELNEVDLYDLVDDLWATKPGVVNDVLLHFVEAARDLQADGQQAALRALESFAQKSKELYVDAFSSCAIHASSFARNDERTQAGLTNIRLQLDFDLVPPRTLLLYADDVGSGTDMAAALPTYGPGCLTFPEALSAGTTPRLENAKADAIQNLERQNVEFFRESVRQVSHVLLSVYQASLSLAKLDAAMTARGNPPRTPRGPGKWLPTFEGGSNMPAAAARYELTSCGTPAGMGYFVEGVQFEGFAGRTLLDAKFWEPGGYMAKGLRGGWLKVGWKVVDQANRQLRVARMHGVDVEWRFASQEVADLVRVIFRNNSIPIRVVHIAPL